MESNIKLKKQKGETKRHYLARKIFFPYMIAKKKQRNGSKITLEFPPFGGQARADIALIIEKPPTVFIEIWVEIQDTKLSEKNWRKKLNTIVKTFNPKHLFVAITENLSSDILLILNIISETTNKYNFFLVDTKKGLINNFQYNDKLKAFKINIENNNIIKDEIKISLDQFLK